MSKKPIKYKSTLEEDVAKQLDYESIDGVYEEEKLQYTIPESEHKYTPDFKIKTIDGGWIYIECKGVGPRYGLTIQTRKKMILIKEQYPGLDIRFVFWNASARIGKGKKSTTYAQWADKHGFPWAHKKICKHWLKEMRCK